VGIVDILSAGFERIAKRLWLILIPVAVDIGIWIGPRLSLNELSLSALGTLASLGELGQEYQPSLEVLRDGLSSFGAQTDLLPLLSMHLLGVPSLTATFPPQARLLQTARPLVEVPTAGKAAILTVSLTMLSLLLGCLFLSWLAQEAREEPANWAYVLHLTWRSWVRMFVLLLVIACVAVALGIGVSLVYALLTLASPQLGAALFSLLAIAMLWLSVYAGIIFFFVPRAIVLDNVGIVRAVWSSLNVVHRNIFSAAIFVLLVNVIQTGLMFIWRLLTTSAVGTLISIAGSAYINTGLALAGFIFYRERFVAWQEAIAHANTSERQA